MELNEIWFMKFMIRFSSDSDTLDVNNGKYGKCVKRIPYICIEIDWFLSLGQCSNVLNENWRKIEINLSFSLHSLLLRKFVVFSEKSNVDKIHNEEILSVILLPCSQLNHRSPERCELIIVQDMKPEKPLAPVVMLALLTIVRDMKYLHYLHYLHSRNNLPQLFFFK